MEEDLDEKVPMKWVVKPIVLPAITFVLKKAWKVNHVKLEATSIFNYLCWL